MRHWTPIGLIFLLTLTAWGGQADELPGAAGPRVRYLNPSAAADVGVAVSDRVNDVDHLRSPADLNNSPQRLPSGTRTIFFTLYFAKPVPLGTNIVIDVADSSGPLKFRQEDSIKLGKAMSKGGVFFTARALDAGAFQDGPYRATVRIDNEAVAELNWSIGG